MLREVDKQSGVTQSVRPPLNRLRIERASTLAAAGVLSEWKSDEYKMYTWDMRGMCLVN